MSDKKMDMSKVLAILSQPKEELPPVEHVERETIAVPFVSKDGMVREGSVNAVIPEGAAKPVPVIYVPHYPMGEDSVEMRSYLAEGWAVVSPSPFNAEFNGQLTDDDLVFNNAALCTLRHRDEFDSERIALVGGSAGGYMTLMLTGLQLGTCVSLANGPIANTYFNFELYWKKAQAMNMAALQKTLAEKAAEDAKKAAETQANAEKTGASGESSGEGTAEPENPALAVMKNVMKLPIPFIAALSGQFLKIGGNFPDAGDMERWEALSGVGVAANFSNPLMVNHNTSDVLVPVDQISKRFTYDKPGDSLPADYNMKLPAGLPGNLSLSLEECLPAEETRTAGIPVPEKAPECDLPYDSGKRFNLNIFDDGAPEGYGTHSARMDTGRRFDVPYLKEYLAKGTAATNSLTPAMLKTLLLRYAGKSIALPAHADADAAVYGSLAMYQKEVREELSMYAKHHGTDELKKIFVTLIASETDKTERNALQSAFAEAVSA